MADKQGPGVGVLTGDDRDVWTEVSFWLSKAN